MISNLFGIMFKPGITWVTIRENSSASSYAIAHVIILAAIPAVMGYFATVKIGWSIGDGPTRFLTADSALNIFVSSYFAQIAVILILGHTIQWMAQTYDSQPSRRQSLALAVYSATPLFLVGFVAFYPTLWLLMLVGLLAIGYSVYLLYTGVPIVMGITSEQGFVFASAILTIGLVMWVGLIVVSVLAWGLGLAPVFT
ncbi:MAG: Yip1 family protein [Pseudomonadota bacterium]